MNNDNPQASAGHAGRESQPAGGPDRPAGREESQKAAHAMCEAGHAVSISEANRLIRKGWKPKA